MIKKLHTLILLLTFSLLSMAEGNNYTTTSLLASGKWIKIRVKDEGVYQLTASSLKNMGFTNPENVRLYGYNIPVLPEANIQLLDDDLTEMPLYHSSNGNLLFYSKGTTEWKLKNLEGDFSHRNNPYSSYIYYFLTEDSSVSPAKFEQQKDAISSVSQSTYFAHSILETDNFSFINCGRTFFDAYDFANGNIKSYSLALEGTPKNGVTLSIQFGAAGTSSSTLSVSCDGTQLGTMAFSKLADYQYASVTSRSFTVQNVATDKLNLTLQHTRASGIAGHLDYIQASYETDLALTNKKYVAFNPISNGSRNVKIKTNGSSNVVLWNVTSPSSTCEIKGEISDQAFNACIKPSKYTDLYVALDPTASFPEPEKVGNVKNQNLHGLSDINLLIIVPSNGKLTAQAQRLADIHTEKDSMKCVVVTADQIYNEFSSGTPDITAYRRLAKMLYDRDNSLQNVLLFGACFWDNRLLTSSLSSKKQDDYLLVWESDNSWSHTDSYPLEEYVVLLDDGEGRSPLREKPDAGVGRIPVTNETEAKQVVDKLISYINNEEAGAWKNTICMMGDDGNANIHMEDAEAVLKYTEAAHPDFRYKRIYWDSYKRQQSATGSSYPDALNEINRTMEEGALIMNYTGHGAAYCLSHEQVLKTNNFAEWSSPRLPLWLTAACDVCPYDMNEENLAVTALLNPKGAAMGFIGTARTVYSTQNQAINKYFMRRVLETNHSGERYTIGEALSLAKCDIIDSKTYLSKIDSINKAEYVLMGDPAIRLLTPTYKVKIDEIGSNMDNEDEDSDAPVLKAGSTVTIKGHIVDEDGNIATNYNGIIYPTIFDSEELITCNNNDDSADEPYTYHDNPRTIFSGSDSISNGKFSFHFSVPLDINYSEDNGLMKLYATNASHTFEAHGTETNFYVGGNGGALPNDTIGPRIIAWLNNPTIGSALAKCSSSEPVVFYNGMHVGKTPTLYAVLSDSVGINTTGNGIGHDIVAIIDGKEATTYTLNNYYSQTVGDYTSGTITYTLPTLEVGAHTLTLRAFNIFNVPSSTTISFVVVEGEETVETFDMSGRLFPSSHLSVLPPGVYVRRYTYRKDNEIIEERTEKFIVSHNK